MRYGRFMLATIAGTLPQTLLYAYLGQAAPQYAWMLLVASGLTVAGTAAVALVRWRKQRAAAMPKRAREGVRVTRPGLRPTMIKQAGGGD
jgi:uncharacterized membrane protein YdjX (TVP38/TMEM64 family)